MIKPCITYDDFVKLDLRVAVVVEASIVEGADKLLKLVLDAGPELGTRVVVSAIRQWYTPESLVGKRIVYLANLEPRMLRGVESQGMIIAAGGDTAVLLQPESDASAGTEVR